MRHALKIMMEKDKAITITRSLAEELNICFHFKNEFNLLFPNNKLQYELYNEIAPNFFYYLSEFYFDYFFLKISKMFDPAKQNNKFENLSLYQLVEIANDLFPCKIDEIKNDVEKIKEEASIILRARNKLLSHKDLNVFLNNENLGKTEFSEIESIIFNISLVINKILGLLGEPLFSFIWITDLYGAKSLIQALKQCSFYHKLCLDPEFFTKIEKIESESKYFTL